MTATSIKTFKDLVVYQKLYKLMILVHQEVIPKLPREEKFDLADQIRRASKAAPALIAEGFAKRYQKLQWNRYITDCIGECNEMIHHLSVCEDLYGNLTGKEKCREHIDQYTIICKQLTKLGMSWRNYHNQKTN